MHSVYQRLQSGFGYFVYANVALTVLISIIAYGQLYFGGALSAVSGHSGNFKASLKMGRMAAYGQYNKVSAETCKLKFDLDYDITPLFNWNTKQVFLYAIAEYPGSRPDINNRVVFWDRIVTDVSDAKKSFSNIESAYKFWNPNRKFREQNATVKLEYNIQPYTGFLQFGEIPLDDGSWFQIPENL